MQDRLPELMAWLERHPVSYTVLTLAALITLAWLADWLTKHILLRSVNRMLKSTALAHDPEVKALRDTGCTGGFMTWNGGSDINKYQSIISALR